MRKSTICYPPGWRVSPPRPITPRVSWTQEKNKGRNEFRAIETCAVTSERVCFPFVAQAARVDQQTSGRKKETVWLLTSRPEAQLSASSWLASRRTYWGIENGLHQRLDASAGDDACRVRTPNAVWILGMFRRLAVSLFIEWRSRDVTRKWCTMTDFYADMRKNNQRRGFLLVTSKQCNLGGKNE